MSPMGALIQTHLNRSMESSVLVVDAKMDADADLDQDMNIDIDADADYELRSIGPSGHSVGPSGQTDDPWNKTGLDNYLESGSGWELGSDHSFNMNGKPASFYVICIQTISWQTLTPESLTILTAKLSVQMARTTHNFNIQNHQVHSN